MSSDATHPTQEQLEAVAFGWIEGEPAQAIRDHAAGCPTCRPFLAAEDAVSRRLALLREYQPPGGLVGDLLRRIEAESPGWLLRNSTAAGVALALVLAGLLAILLFNQKPTRRRGRRRGFP